MPIIEENPYFLVQIKPNRMITSTSNTNQRKLCFSYDRGEPNSNSFDHMTKKVCEIQARSEEKIEDIFKE